MNRPLATTANGSGTATHLTQIAIVAAIYFGAAKLGLSMTFTAKQVSLVWPPTGIALAAVLLAGYRVWPGIALGAFLANVTTPNETAFTACGIAVGNTLEAVVGAWLLWNLVGFQSSLERFKDVLGLVGLAASTSTMVSATIGVATLCLGGVHSWSSFLSLWWIWCLGDAIGDLMVAPVILVWASRPAWRWRPVRSAEAVFLFATFIVMGLLVLTDLWLPLAYHPLNFSLFSLMIWAALRFGQRGTTLATMLASSIAVWGMFHESSSINQADENLAVLQSFLGVLATSGLFLSAAISERNTADRRRTAGYETTRIVSESASLAEASPRIISTVCHTLEWDVGAVWRVDENENVLRCVDVWHRPGLGVSEFVATTRDRAFVSGVGLPGRVWASGQPVWILDVVHDANFPRAPIANREHLHGAFGFPIRSRDRTLGVIEFFSHDIRQPDEDLLRLMATIGSQIGQFIERRQSEEALAAAQAQLQEITDTMAAGVTRCSRDGRYLWVSRGYAEWLGRSPDEFTGRPIVEIVGEAAYETIRPRIERVLAGQRVEYEDVLDYRGVGRRWVHAAYVPTFDTDRVPNGWVAVILDISQRKFAEQAFLDSEERNRSIVDHAADGIISINERGVIASFNPAAEKLFGYATSEVVGQNIKLLMPDPYRGDHDGYLEQYLRTGQAKIIGIGREVVGRRKDGSEFPMDLAVSEFSQGGKKFFTGIVRDITERKRAEQQLREADRRKDEFLGMLAHELRNPLAAISYASQLLDRNLPAIPQMMRPHETIKRQTANLSRMVDDLLDVSRITSGKIRLNKESLNVTSIVERTVEIVRPLMESKRHDFQMSIEPQTMRIEGDVTRLEQVLVNLLNNAAKFTDPGGRISLTVEQSSNGQAARKDEIVFRVADDGVGIPPDMMPHIFDLFTQVDKSLARSQGGLGIGLSLVQRLVALHGGTVEASSAGVGHGSMFTVRLPSLPMGQDAALPSTPTGDSSSVVVCDTNRD